jgi:hypothetical protein
MENGRILCEVPTMLDGITSLNAAVILNYV